MRIGGQGVEQEMTLYDDLPFVEKQDVPADDDATPAYTFEGPEGYVVFVAAGTPFAPEFRDANGDPLDGSTRVIWQKCDRQGNPIGDGIVINEMIGRWDFDQMRNDPDYFRGTQKDLMLDEREIAKIFLDIPAGASAFSAAKSRLTVGDDTSDFGVPVEIVDTDDLNDQELAAVKMASTRGGN